MLFKESPLRSSMSQKPTKLQNHESPITKLINLTQIRNSYQHTKKDNVLNDRSNEVYMPKNAQKFVEETYQRQAHRQKQIDEIRKKYYQDLENKSRTTSQKYDRYEYSRQRQNVSDKRDENMRQIQQPTRRQALFTNRQLSGTSSGPHVQQSLHKKPTTNQRPPIIITTRTTSLATQQPSRQIPISRLQKISEASNSNYETITKTVDTLSPERHRVKSSYVFEDRSSKKKINQPYYGIDWKLHGDKQSFIKETTSVYDRSLKSSSKYDKTPKPQPYTNERQLTPKSNKADHILSGNESNVLKPFSIEDQATFRQPSQENILRHPTQSVHSIYKPENGYPTIYDNYLPKSYDLPNASITIQKCQREEQIHSSTRPRHLTYDKKYCNNSIETQKLHNQQKVNPKKRVLQFEDDERMKEIERRLKEREAQFKRKQQNLRAKCDNQVDLREKTNQSFVRTTEFNINQRPSTPGKKLPEKQSVDKQIERLSQKIKQFQDKKKQLYKDTTNKALPKESHTKKVQSSDSYQPSNKYEDARKELQQYRGVKAKSSNEIFEAHKYRLKSSGNQSFYMNINNCQQQTFTKRRQAITMDIPKQSQRRCEFIQNTKPMYSERTLPEPRRNQQRQQPSRFAFQLYKIQSQIQDSSSSTSKVTTFTGSKTNASECRTQFDIHKRADEGMEQRKKKLQENGKIGSTQQMKRLVTLLSKQSAHDEEFRNCKIWFHNNRDGNKWKQLKKCLEKLNQMNFTITQQKDGTISQFHVCEDENNPFFSVNQQSKFTYEALAQSFIQTKQFWHQNIAKKFDRTSLIANCFTHEKFDLEKKGFINLEDFVRFLNFESGNFYRNRDLVLIFKRLMNENDEKSEKSLTIQKILNVLTY